MRKHPFNLYPLGNLLTATACPSPRSKSLGLLHQLPDSLLLRIIDFLLPPHIPALQSANLLCVLSTLSTAFRHFSFDEDLWRRLTLSHFPVHVLAQFKYSWRHTFIKLASGNPYQPKSYIDSKPFFSDVLFLKWRCLHTPIHEDWLRHDDVPCIDARNVSVHEFRQSFEDPSLPVVIRGLVDKWPAFQNWTRQGLQKRCEDVKFNAGGYQFGLNDYWQYCDAIEGHDDQPLYVFDQHFGEKAPKLVSDYDVPKYFAQDMFGVLGEQRPDYRWLIMGPARSGSSFHKDPNGTSAWNAVVKGSKKWILFPPECPPPGVVPSGDEGDVVAPVSVTEWFLNFYDRQVVETLGGRECIVREGECIFVPMGWWHCVLNVEAGVAVTQNYVSESNIREVAKWLQEKPMQVSGCRSAKQREFIVKEFAVCVVQRFPLLAQKLAPFLPASKRGNAAMENHDTVASVKKRTVGLWESLQTRGQGANGAKRHRGNPSDELGGESCKAEVAGFSFGF